ncbi:RRXRR domain-containing protein [Actinomadura rudentiformis]|uniref:RRXRR domain-containing protein n=1 Tax=Actinomadura rudentiformis TaxID=359158 RepID=A0A6H9Z1J0_9ACTN|nr:RRXRR domain-containing protein [Actinomadura rudentiformis]KAB2350425.1 hypothetical protein F8566_11370 [Actinomadura rudentiformis]
MPLWSNAPRSAGRGRPRWSGWALFDQPKPTRIKEEPVLPAARFDNLARPQRWLAPSFKHRVDTTVSWVDRLSRWAPVRAVRVEHVAFDTHLLRLGPGRPLPGSGFLPGLKTRASAGGTGEPTVGRLHCQRRRASPTQISLKPVRSSCLPGFSRRSPRMSASLWARSGAGAEFEP